MAKLCIKNMVAEVFALCEDKTFFARHLNIAFGCALARRYLVYLAPKTAPKTENNA